jgi:choline dehydrogenase-like flavoprotein
VYTVDRTRPYVTELFVVVGSGYGGSIAASRLARAGSVCLLERGRELQPGEYPDNVIEVGGMANCGLRCRHQSLYAPGMAHDAAQSTSRPLLSLTRHRSLTCHHAATTTYLTPGACAS